MSVEGGSPAGGAVLEQSPLPEWREWPIRIDMVPLEMALLRQWMGYRVELNKVPGGKPGKVPEHAGGKRRGKNGTADDLQRMMTLGEAIAEAQRRGQQRFVGGAGLAGVGFAMLEGSDISCIDLDRMWHDEAGRLVGTPDQMRLVAMADALGAFIEKSPSGKGLHIWGRSTNRSRRGSDEAHIEVISTSGWVTVTGVAFGSCSIAGDLVGTELEDITAVVELALTLSRKAEPTKPTSGAMADASRDDLAHLGTEETFQEIQSALKVIPADDYTQWVSFGHALRPFHTPERPDAGRDLWLEWSATSSKFDEAEATEKWETFTGDRTGFAAVFAEAQRRGWVNPRSHQAPTKKHEPKGYRLLSAEEVMSRPPARERVRGVLPEDGLAAVFGRSGDGKTFLTLDILGAIAEGRDWFGHRVSPCPVVYLALEGEAGIGKRLKAYRQRHGGTGAQMWFVAQPFALLDAGDIDELAEAIKAAGGGGGIVAIDTLNRASPGADENDSKDMGAIIDGAKRLQSALGGLVLLVHHSGKDASKGLRGHSSLHAALDAVIEVTREGDRREWRCSKSKDGADGEAHPFRLEPIAVGVFDDGDPITSCVVVPEDRAVGSIRKARLPQGKNQQLALDTIGQLLGATFELGKGGAPTDRPCVTVEVALEAIRARVECESFRKVTVAKTTLESLIERGFLAESEGWLWAL